MKIFLLVLLFTGCTKPEPQQEEIAHCRDLPTADFRNYCNQRCEKIVDEANKKECFFYREHPEQAGYKGNK